MEQLFRYYSDIPYHNAPHGRGVMHDGTLLGLTSVAEMFATGGHDILHTGTVRPGDEEISARVAKMMALVHGVLLPSQTRESENLIEGTIFHNRREISGKQQLIADADIASIGKNFNIYAKNAAKLFVEKCFSDGNPHPSLTQVMDFWTHGQEGFFSYLTSITGNPDNPFLTDRAKLAFPNFPRNRDTVRELAYKNPRYLVDIVRNEWQIFFRAPLVLQDELNT